MPDDVSATDHDVLVGYLDMAWRHVIPSGPTQEAMVRLGFLGEVPRHRLAAPTWTEGPGQRPATDAASAAECDDCSSRAEALVAGYNPVLGSGWAEFVEPCVTPGCRWYEPTADAVVSAADAEDDGRVEGEPDAMTAESINALRHQFSFARKHTEGEPIKGWLSTLVWNTRNHYLGFPESTFPAEQVRLLVEGFMAEVERLRAERDDLTAEIKDGYGYMQSLTDLTTDPGTGTLAWLHRNEQRARG